MQTNTTPQPNQKKKSSLWKWLLGIFAALFVLAQFGKDEKPTATESMSVDTTSSVAASTSASSTPISEPSAAPVSNWSYFDNEDKMGAKVHVASVTATELLDFDFPYNGGSVATFTIRKKGGNTDVYLQVSKGQFITNVVDGGTCRIRFDSGTPKTYSTSGAADYSSDIVFFDSEQAIIKRLKKASKMIVEVEFYNEGSRQIEFDVSNLKWK